MDRSQRMLAGLFVVQLVLLAILHPPFAHRAASGGGPLLPTLASITPRSVQVAGSDGTQVTLERREGAWALAEPPGYPVLAGKVEKLIQDLEKLTAGRQVVSGARYHASLKVANDAFERRVRLWDKPGGDPKLELYVGTSPGADVTHMRVGGSDKVYEVAGLSSYDLPADAGQWVERRLVDVQSTDVGGITITNRRGSFALEKRAGEWAVKAPAAKSHAELDQAKVSELVTTLCGVTLDEPAAALNPQAQGFAAPEATIVLERAPARPDSVAAGRAMPGGAPAAAPGGAPAGPPVTIRIGALVPGKQDVRFAARGDMGFAVTVAKYVSDRPDTVTLGELMKQPPPAVASASARPSKKK